MTRSAWRTRIWACACALLQLWAGGCAVIVNEEPLTGGCPADEKACDGRCVSRSDPEFGCSGSSCLPCVLPNSTSVCDADEQCAIAACVGNFEDCDGKDDNGCEVNLDTDVDHCGDCDAPECKVSGAVAACARGACAIRKCLPGYRDCNRLDADGCETALTSLQIGVDFDGGNEADSGQAPVCDPWASD